MAPHSKRNCTKKFNEYRFEKKLYIILKFFKVLGRVYINSYGPAVYIIILMFIFMNFVFKICFAIFCK